MSGSNPQALREHAGHKPDFPPPKLSESWEGEIRLFCYPRGREDELSAGGRQPDAK